jgi:thioredoxin reductase
MDDKAILNLDGRSIECEPGISLAAALSNAKVHGWGTDVADGRRVVCGMGACFACRVQVNGEVVRACSVSVPAGTSELVRLGARLPLAAPPEGEAGASGSTGVRRQVDVAVVGAGPAGLAAAVRACETGARVMMIDASGRAGGQIWRHRERAPAGAQAWVDRFERAGGMAMPLAEVFDAVAHSEGVTLWVRRPEGVVRIDAATIVLATGARERWIPFVGSTLPGVMGVGALQASVKQGLVVQGAEVVLAGTGPLALAAAADLRDAGASVKIIEQVERGRAWSLLPALAKRPGKFGQAGRLALKLGPRSTHYGSWIRRVQTDAGRLRVELGGKADRRSLLADWVGCAFGLVPEIRLGRLLGCDAVTRLEGEALSTDAQQRTSVARVFAAGEACGIGGVEAALAEGEIAGLAAAGADSGDAASLGARRTNARAFAARLRETYAVRPDLIEAVAGEALACRCEGVTVASLRQARDGRQARLLDRCAMGPCQGRTCAAAIREFTSTGVDRSRVRPPLVPVTLGELAEAWGDTP